MLQRSSNILKIIILSSTLLLPSCKLAHDDLPCTLDKDEVGVILDKIKVDIPEKEINCLAKTIYFEARGEPLIGQQAVGMVVLNRKLHKEFPNTICGVMSQRNQFSWYGKLSKIRNKALYNKIKITSRNLYISYLLNGNIPEGLEKYKDATFFQVGRKKNNRRLAYLGKIGTHNFWRIIR